MSVWLAICLAEPAQLHTCAMHGGLAIEVAPHSGSHAAVHHTAASGIAAPQSDAAHGHSHNDQNADGHANQCSCLGDCSTGKAPVDFVASEPLVVSPSVAAAKPVFSYASPTLVSPGFLLPFSNGPPVASSRA